MEIELEDKDITHSLVYPRRSLCEDLQLNTSHCRLKNGEFHLIKSTNLCGVYFYHFNDPFPASSITMEQLEISKVLETPCDKIDLILPAVPGENNNIFCAAPTFAAIPAAFILAQKMANKAANKAALEMAREMERKFQAVVPENSFNTL